jgi:hypothetical protein
MNQRIRIPSLFFMLACWSLCNALQDANAQSSSPTDAPATQYASQTIAASDPRFRYEGRFDMSDPSGPRVIWEASRISLDFAGPTLKFLFSNNRGQYFFDASVDGVTKIIELRQGRRNPTVTFSDLGAGRHHLKLFKRSEATAGTVSFNGVELAVGARAWAPPPPAYKTTMEFIGDSVDAGACVEDGATDQWDDQRTHNSAKSYTTLTAVAFDADHQNISVSGIGIVTGFVPCPAGQIWDRVNADSNSPKADLTQWTPQIVFVHLGDNDDSYPRSRRQPFPTNFTDAYIGFTHTDVTSLFRAT